jgi:ABC-type antimicrobial peptide transport system permease subunit
MITSVDAFHQLVQANQVDYATALAQNSTLVAYDANAVTDIRYARLLVKMHPAIAGNKGERSSLVNRLQVSLDPYSHSTVVTPDLVDSISSAVDLIIVFFYFVCIVAVILDTFMLWLTFVSNVQLNAWSFGVLRSLGFTAAQLTRAFVYEALTLVIGSFIIGTIVGFIVAITVVLQMNLILQSPFEINFPYGLFGFLLGLSLISAVVGSVVPSRAVSSRPIAVVLKKG